MGSSAVRVLAGTASGEVLGVAHAPVSYVNIDSSYPLSREFDPDRLFARTGDLVKQVLKETGVKGAEVAAIGITSQRQGSVFLDREGKELYAGPNMDLRATMEGAAIDEEIGQEVYQTTGHLPSLMFTPARLKWFRNHQPHIYDRMARVLAIAAWMAYRMTGMECCETSLAGEVGLLDIQGRKRCGDLLAKMEIDTSLFPPLSKAGTPVGGLSPRVAREWGLSPDTPVTLAGPDTQSGLVGMGAIAPGMTGLVAGWSCTLQTVTDGPQWDGERHTWAGCLPVGGRWIAESNMGDGGHAYNWLVMTLLDGHDRYERSEEMVTEIEPGSDGAMAFLGPGPESMSSAGMRVGGFTFYTPLSFQTVSKGQLLRASLENLAYSARANLEKLEGVIGRELSVVHLGGGLSRSAVFSHVLAGVLGREVRRSSLPEVSTWGALLAASAAAGEYPNLETAATERHCPSKKLLPSPLESAEYQELYEHWKEAYYTLQETT
jgi:sugar (pentulose or hexulose) kinase